MDAARRAEPAGEPAPHRVAPPTLPSAVYPDWDAIYADNVARLYRLVFAKVGNRADAEDLTSQVFLTAYGRLRTSASVGEVRSYLVATARTVLAEHWRRTLGHQVTEIDPDQVDLADYTAEDRSAWASDAAARSERILAGLPARQRDILALRFLRGYTIREAAAELGISIANAKVLQHRALRRAAGIEQDHEQEGDGR